MCELQMSGLHWHLQHVSLISTQALTFRSFLLNFNNFENGILFWKGGFQMYSDIDDEDQEPNSSPSIVDGVRNPAAVTSPPRV
ncbi:conserved hypothetical protein, partial [Trichinella spiralis]|uniref:hypothetical protein n=1 Tax=Trichinella spiralis TaxID=6334 RepID=UPI0001EFC0ED